MHLAFLGGNITRNHTLQFKQWRINKLHMNTNYKEVRIYTYIDFQFATYVKVTVINSLCFLNGYTVVNVCQKKTKNFRFYKVVTRHWF